MTDPTHRAQELEQRVKQLEELHTMQLCAVMTATVQNTEATRKDRITKGNEYYTQAYEDVCRAIDREMVLIEKVKQLEAASACFIGLLQKCIDQVLSEQTDFKGENRAAWIWRDIDAALDENPHGKRFLADYAKLEAACAEMRDALEMAKGLIEHSNRGAFENGVKDSTGSIDEGEVVAGRIYEQIRKALSSDAGKGWRSPDDYAKLEAERDRLKQIISSVRGCSVHDWELMSCSCNDLMDDAMNGGKP